MARMMPDILVQDCGTVVMLVANTARARTWLAQECATEPWQWNGPALAVEPRCVEDIRAGAESADLTVEPGRCPECGAPIDEGSCTNPECPNYDQEDTETAADIDEGEEADQC
jgi:hypothetical protein